MKLLELCGLLGTLVIDEDGIYDMSDFNDRLLIGLKGTMGEAELHFLHVRMIGGKENAAAKGELRFPLPVGYIRDLDGNAIMDPDEEVQNALFTLFREFRATGSAYGVVRYFAQNNLSFPKRAYGGAWDGKNFMGNPDPQPCPFCYSQSFVYRHLCLRPLPGHENRRCGWPLRAPFCPTPGQRRLESLSPRTSSGLHFLLGS